MKLIVLAVILVLLIVLLISFRQRDSGYHINPEVLSADDFVEALLM
jgi:hypothetical protein